jgi:hypothetical protein
MADAKISSLRRPKWSILRIARYPPAASQIATARTYLSFIGAPESDRLP